MVRHRRLVASDVCLVDARDAPPAPRRKLEGELDDAPDLVLGVRQQVRRVALGRGRVAIDVGRLAGLVPLAEVEAAGQLAEDQQVHAAQPLLAQRRGVDECRLQGDRPQVGEQPQPLRSLKSACSGRTVAFGLSQRGPPTAPSSTASAAWHSARSSSRRAVP